MRVLVTGAGGFLGRYIVEQLVERGDQVRGLARGAYPELTRVGVEMLQGDIRDADLVGRACQGMDAVVHTAAVAGLWGPRAWYFGINADGTRHVLDGCRRAGVGRLVHCSSPSVTFDGGHQSGVDESAPYPDRWLSHYSHSKAIAERMVLEGNSPDLRTCALRPHLIWGPRDGHLMPRLISRSRSGQLRRVGDGANRIDMIYVENAALAHVQAIAALDEGRACGKAYFLSQGEPVRCWEWVDQLLALAGRPPVRRAVSYATAWRVGLMLEGLWWTLRLRSEPPMTRFLAAQLARDHYFDISASRRDLGYVPRVDTAEGLRRLGEWLRA